MDWNSQAVESKISLAFKHSDLLFLALSHPSYAEQIHEPERNYERLIFLGDAIAALAIADYLYEHCPYLKVSNYKGLTAKLLEGERLTKTWIKLGLGDDYPFMVAKEQRPILAQKVHNPFEESMRALIGAIHCDRGYPQTRNWLVKHLIAPLLKKYLKDETERAEPDLQQRFWGRALVTAITADWLYHTLNEVEPKYLNRFHRTLIGKPQVKAYKEKSLTAGNDTGLNLNEFIAQTYLAHSHNNRNAYGTTYDWLITTFIDQDEVLRDAITQLLRDGKPQKWIIRNVLGYASKDYQAGRERFYEILEEEMPTGSST
ncbi:ribonuclease III domain-containing protein [Spirulina major]|uniref:ribonuclease III domain-containing protein n=1 Tax=Spirulina major TaxID=270636 RepID=UPI00093305F0|nr:ribonuclease III domain-containing protein [Spirulina major]